MVKLPIPDDPAIEWEESDPTIQTEVLDSNTAPHSVEALPGYEPGFRRGMELGFGRAMGALRSSLVDSGIPTDAIPGILARVHKRISGG